MSTNAILMNGSICVTDLIDAYQKGHTAFSRSAKNQKVYANITEWVNQDADQFGNHASILLNSAKDKEPEDLAKFGKKCYVGNLKKSDYNGGAIPADQRNDFAGLGSGAVDPAGTGQPAGPTGGLPF